MNAADSPRMAPLRDLAGLALDNRFAQLGDAYSSRVAPAPLTNPQLLHANAEVAELLDLDPAQLHTPQFIEIFAGNRPQEWLARLPGELLVATHIALEDDKGFLPVRVHTFHARLRYPPAAVHLSTELRIEQRNRVGHPHQDVLDKAWRAAGVVDATRAGEHHAIDALAVRERRRHHRPHLDHPQPHDQLAR